ncbi:hypothetical protein BDR03DRAFT_980890 [Suillus americanus]|nr:hypothetical protein BDR03DRAFT_980890 [Suillus americanus]
MTLKRARGHFELHFLSPDDEESTQYPQEALDMSRRVLETLSVLTTEVEDIWNAWNEQDNFVLLVQSEPLFKDLPNGNQGAAPCISRSDIGRSKELLSPSKAKKIAQSKEEKSSTNNNGCNTASAIYSEVVRIRDLYDPDSCYPSLGTLRNTKVECPNIQDSQGALIHPRDYRIKLQQARFVEVEVYLKLWRIPAKTKVDQMMSDWERFAYFKPAVLDPKGKRKASEEAEGFDCDNEFTPSTCLPGATPVKMLNRELSIFKNEMFMANIYNHLTRLSDVLAFSATCQDAELADAHAGGHSLYSFIVDTLQYIHCRKHMRMAHWDVQRMSNFLNKGCGSLCPALWRDIADNGEEILVLEWDSRFSIKSMLNRSDTMWHLALDCKNLTCPFNPHVNARLACLLANPMPGTQLSIRIQEERIEHHRPHYQAKYQGILYATKGQMPRIISVPLQDGVPVLGHVSWLQVWHWVDTLGPDQFVTSTTL